MELYRVLKEEFPRSHVCRKVPLGFLKGPAFRDMIDQYLRPPLHKGVPSLWIGLKALYENKEKVRKRMRSDTCIDVLMLCRSLSQFRLYFFKLRPL